MSLPVCPSAFIRFAVADVLGVVDALDGRRWGGHHESRRERHTIGKVAVHGGAGDAQHFRDVGGRDALVPELRALAASASSTLRGRPPLRPLA